MLLTADYEWHSTSVLPQMTRDISRDAGRQRQRQHEVPHKVHSDHTRYVCLSIQRTHTHNRQYHHQDSCSHC